MARRPRSATPGYFAKQRNRRGRQLGRVLATRYHEIVVDRLFDGKTQLNVRPCSRWSLAAEQTLELDEAQRQRTLVRIDAGAGSISDSNWLLFRGYHVLAKDYSTKRATLLAAQVTDWIVDPRDSARQIGLVPVPASRLSCWAASADGDPCGGALSLGERAMGRRRGDLHPAPRRGTAADGPGPGR